MSGTVSVQVVQKTKSRKQRVLKSLGSANPNDTASLEKLMQQASSFIQEMEGPSLPHIYEKGGGDRRLRQQSEQRPGASGWP